MERGIKRENKIRGTKVSMSVLLFVLEKGKSFSQDGRSHRMMENRRPLLSLFVPANKTGDEEENEGAEVGLDTGMTGTWQRRRHRWRSFKLDEVRGRRLLAYEDNKEPAASG